MRALLLVFSLHTGSPAPADRWFAADKVKHFFASAFTQSVAFGAFRLTGQGRHGSLVGAASVAAAVGIGKEIYDLKTGGDASFKDLAWDGVGIVAGSVVMAQTGR
jgi:uncharacterized protein YfiM (DUF2279 family)